MKNKQVQALGLYYNGKYTYDFTNLAKIKWRFTEGKNRTKICQNIMALDIENSSGYHDRITGKVHSFNHRKYKRKALYRYIIDHAAPVSLVYLWQVAIESADGTIWVFVGRSTEDFLEFWELLSAYIRKASCAWKKTHVKAFWYVHNLSHEFNVFLRNVTDRYMDTDFKLFARSTHKPLYARLKVGAVNFEFRCSYFLTNKSLRNWAKDEQLPIQKEQPIDYLRLRTPATPLSDEVIKYAVADVVVMIYGLDKYRTKYGTIENIPLTSTGEIRRVLQRTAVEHPDFAMQCYTISQSYSYDDFIRLTKTYSGGWTHGNSRYIGKVIRPKKGYYLGGIDFASSYPSVMCNYAGFPISPFTEYDPHVFTQFESEDVEHPQHAWYAKVELFNVTARTNNTLWSLSKCEEVDTIHSPRIDNGRIEHTDHMVIYLTNLDWDTFKKAYRYDSYEVHELYAAEAGYLPTPLVEVVLRAFADKTALKGVDGAESAYAAAKAIVNGIYGLEVYKLLNWIVTYKDGEWEKYFPTKEQGGEDYYKEELADVDPLQCYTWYASGVWITAAARWRLWQAILQMDKRVIYCDTDSIKALFTEDDIKWVEDFNDHIKAESDAAAAFHGIDPNLYCPKTKKGVTKRLGIFEIDGDPIDPARPYEIYKGFITQGAKRYAYIPADGKIHTTVAGLPKTAGPRVIKTLEDFNDGAEWDTEQSGRLTVYYAEMEDGIKWKGEGGNTYTSHDRFAVCMKPTTFNMSLSGQFKAFLDYINGAGVDETYIDDNKIMLF